MMGIVEALDETSTKAVDLGAAYVDTTKKYYELKLFQQLALVSTQSCTLVLYGLCLFLGIIFLAIGAAVALNAHYDNPVVGYVTVGLCFFILMLLIYALRRKIEKRVINKLSDIYFDQ